MEREDAINYLQRKGKIRDATKVTVEKDKPVTTTKIKRVKETEYVDPKFDKKEQKKIQQVIKEGKIHGDPSAEIEF